MSADSRVTQRFQSTPPRRGRPGGPAARRSPECRFNPRPREGGGTRPSANWTASVRFQSTPPRRGRHGAHYQHAQRRRVSIHAPAKGAAIDTIHRQVRILVSIHAPAKGAARGAARGELVAEVSIHAPAKGAARRICRTCSCSRRFNPRPREGGGMPVLAVDGAGVDVSIHAPAKGAAQPRHRPAPWCCFNPRPREGGGGCRDRPERRRKVSIHAPAKGAASLTRTGPR